MRLIRLRAAVEGGGHAGDLQFIADNFAAPTFRTVVFQMGERLPERLREMCFVEDDDGVGSSEAGVDGVHFWADTVATKEKARTELIDRREADRGLNRGPRPCGFERHAAA